VTVRDDQLRKSRRLFDLASCRVRAGAIYDPFYTRMIIVKLADGSLWVNPVVVVSGYFEITAASVAPNRNRTLPLRFDFKDCLNASLNWSSG
jgi:hypothetical protein